MNSEQVDPGHNLHFTQRPSDEIESSLTQILNLFDLSVTHRLPPVRGSWYRAFVARTKKAARSPELKTRLEKIERAIEIQALHRHQAEIDSVQGTGNWARPNGTRSHASVNRTRIEARGSDHHARHRLKAGQVETLAEWTATGLIFCFPSSTPRAPRPHLAAYVRDGRLISKPFDDDENMGYVTSTDLKWISSTDR